MWNVEYLPLHREKPLTCPLKLIAEKVVNQKQIITKSSEKNWPLLI
jgi:hypothetical protein